jgi:hypothetical protein
VIDFFARYQITDALRFYQTVANIESANSWLLGLLNASLHRVLGEVT